MPQDVTSALLLHYRIGEELQVRYLWERGERGWIRIRQLLINHDKDTFLSLSRHHPPPPLPGTSPDKDATG